MNVPVHVRKRGRKDVDHTTKIFAPVFRSRRDVENHAVRRE